MKKKVGSMFLALVMVLCLVPVTAMAGEEGITINAENFPDEAFREKVVRSFDTNLDGVLSASEIQAVTNISCYGCGIKDLTGIQYFTELTTLDCADNLLTTLNISKNEKLQNLYLERNQISTLNVSDNPELKDLDCTGNLLTELNVQSNKALEYLTCDKNQLSSLDVGQNTELVSLRFSYNQLTSIDLSNLSKLRDTLLSTGNEYAITAKGGVFDLTKLPGSFDVSKASNWTGGTVSGNTLTINDGASKVTYIYDCGKGYTETFTLNVTVVAGDGAVEIPAEKQKDNYAAGEIKNSAEEIKKTVLTEEDKTAVEAGKDVTVWVEIKDQENTVSDADKTAVENKLSSGYRVGTYLDISLWKHIDGENADEKVTNVPYGKVTIGFTIPADLQKAGRTYMVVRVHNGVATVLDASVNANYELTFETDQFSTYALVYKDGTSATAKTSTAKTSTGKTNAAKTKATVKTASPKTGDYSNMFLWLVLLLAGSGAVTVTTICGRKK